MFQSVDYTLSEELLYRFAPILQFHPQERWFPTSMEETFIHSQRNGKLNRSTIDYNSPQYKAVIISQLKQDSQSKQYYLQYWFYYTWNGCQCFKITQIEEEDETKLNDIWFEWPPIAEHQSDFETVTLEVNPNGQSIERIMVFSHGESIWRKYDSHLPKRPHLYVALNSHAMYLTEKDISFIDKNKFFDQHVSQIMEWISGGQSKDLDIVDVVEAKHRIITSPKYPTRESNSLLMDVRDEGILLVQSDHFSGSRDWMNWKGPWGQRTYQQDIKYPPEGVPDRFWYKLILWLAIKSSLANKFVRNVKAGVAPWFRPEWKNIAHENPSEFKNYTNVVKDLGLEK